MGFQVSDGRWFKNKNINKLPFGVRGLKYGVLGPSGVPWGI